MINWETKRERKAQENWYGYGLFESHLYPCAVLVIHGFNRVCFDIGINDCRGFWNSKKNTIGKDLLIFAKIEMALDY